LRHRNPSVFNDARHARRAADRARDRSCVERVGNNHDGGARRRRQLLLLLERAVVGGKAGHGHFTPRVAVAQNVLDFEPR
jgi:hypothetical protein